MFPNSPSGKTLARKTMVVRTIMAILQHRHLKQLFVCSFRIYLQNHLMSSWFHVQVTWIEFKGCSSMLHITGCSLHKVTNMLSPLVISPLISSLLSFYSSPHLISLLLLLLSSFLLSPTHLSFPLVISPLLISTLFVFPSTPLLISPILSSPHLVLSSTHFSSPLCISPLLSSFSPLRTEYTSWLLSD